VNGKEKATRVLESTHRELSGSPLARSGLGFGLACGGGWGAARPGKGGGGHGGVA
jgi:hypothetical protein